MKEYKVKIRGKTPYMQHQMRDEDIDKWEKSRGKIIERPEVSQEDSARAEYSAFRDDKGKLYMPSEHLRGALINAGTYMKSKVGNSRKSMKNVVAAMFYIKEDKLPLPQKFSIDKRTAVNKNVKARVIVIRPKWEEWETTFTLRIDNDTITKETVNDLLEYAGNYVGVGSFRPEHSGMFGRFEVTKLAA